MQHQGTSQRLPAQVMMEPVLTPDICLHVHSTVQTESCNVMLNVQPSRPWLQQPASAATLGDVAVDNQPGFVEHLVLLTAGSGTTAGDGGQARLATLKGTGGLAYRKTALAEELYIGKA